MKSAHASVQSFRVGVETITDGVVRIRTCQYRAVLEVAGIATALDDESQREAVLAGYAAFLNALTFPIQVLVRTVPVDLGRYLGGLEERAGRELPVELAGLARDHAAFVQRLARQRTLLERRFYIVVPAQSELASRRPTWLTRSRRGDEVSEADAARRQLTFRCDEVARQLGRCGLGARRLGDLELAELYLACWAPERARVQRFHQQLDDYTAFAVRGARRSGWRRAGPRSA
jgi:hypothetical protein